MSLASQAQDTVAVVADGLEKGELVQVMARLEMGVGQDRSVAEDAVVESAGERFAEVVVGIPEEPSAAGWLAG